MAFADTVRSFRAPFGANLATSFREALDAFKARRAAYKVYRTTRIELYTLSNRELQDLGFSRSEIERVAIETAYGPQDT